MINLKDINFLDMLPQFIREDKTIKTISEIIDEELQYIEQRETLGIYGVVDTLIEKELDELGYQWVRQLYKQDYSIEIKREVIKNAYFIQSKRGTKDSLEALVKLINKDVDIIEWFNYGGEPYHFKLTSDKQITGEELTALEEIIKYAKNERSSLDGIIISDVINKEIFIGGTTHLGLYEVIELDQREKQGLEKALRGY